MKKESLLHVKMQKKGRMKRWKKIEERKNWQVDAEEEQVLACAPSEEYSIKIDQIFKTQET